MPEQRGVDDGAIARAEARARVAEEHRRIRERLGFREAGAGPVDPFYRWFVDGPENPRGVGGEYFANIPAQRVGRIAADAPPMQEIARPNAPAQPIVNPHPYGAEGPFAHLCHTEQFNDEGRPIACRNCGHGHTYLRTDGMGNMYPDGTIMCPRCNYADYGYEQQRRREEQRRQAALRAPARINNYTYKPDPRFFGRSSSGLYFGIEHEVEVDQNHDPSDITWKIYNESEQKDLMYFKQDGSLVHGFEMVSHPMSFNYFTRHYPEAVKTNLAQYCKNNWEGNYQCGIHIHMSWDAFGKRSPVALSKKAQVPGARVYLPKPQRPSYHLYKFMQFIYNNPEFVQNIAGRDRCIIHEHEMATYDKNAAVHWVREDKETRRAVTDPDRGLREAAKGKRLAGMERYVAVNLMNPNTIELRIFRSTTNHRRLAAYVQFADALFYYSKIVQLHNKRRPDKAMSTAGYEAYVRARPTRYADLIGVLDNNPDLAV